VSRATPPSDPTAVADPAPAPAWRGAPRLPARVPRAVVFDMDGLMLDTERLDRDLWRAAVRRRALDIPDSLHARLVGRRAVDAEAILRAHFGGAFPLEEIKAEVQVRWEAIAAGPGLPRKPGLEALLLHLEQARIPKAVATSTARGKALVSLGPLAARFQALACGDEVREGKPAPEIFELAARRLGLAVEDCLALEDSPAGVAAARSARMSVIMIPDLVAPAEPPEFVCESLGQVLDWLLAQQAVPG